MASNGASNGGGSLTINGETNGWDPDERQKIISSLRTNGGLSRIQSTLRQRLDESGWSEDLKDYCTALFRSGAATTYDDALKIVMRRIDAREADPSGTEDGVPAPNLAIPSDAQTAGADAVTKELKAVVKRNSKNGAPVTGIAEDDEPRRASNETGMTTEIKPTETTVATSKGPSRHKKHDSKQELSPLPPSSAEKSSRSSTALGSPHGTSSNTTYSTRHNASSANGKSRRRGSIDASTPGLDGGYWKR